MGFFWKPHTPAWYMAHGLFAEGEADWTMELGNHESPSRQGMLGL